ncbi:MAG: hypothetical protein ACI4M6_05120 [Christensenellaceae bacterium]
MKFVNFNLVYDEFVKSFIDKNKNKYTVSRLEDIQPLLFEKFKTQKIKNIGDVSVTEYYERNRERLIDILKQYLKQNTEPDEFLIEAIEKYVDTDTLVGMLSPLCDADFLNVIIKVLDDLNFDDYGVYIELLKNEKTPSEAVNAIIDVLKAVPDKVYKQLIEADISDDRAVCEIICEITKSDDAVTDYLKKAFLRSGDKMSEYSDYIVRYGDESLLGALLDAVKKNDIGYLEYKELKIAIEALGGRYDEKRDFSYDKNYKLLKGEDD